MISLFADSGMRLSEPAGIKASQIDWKNYLITIWGKGGKQRKAPFTKRTAKLLEEYMSQNGVRANIWHLNTWGIISVLRRLEQKSGLPCNPHTFREYRSSRGLAKPHQSSYDLILGRHWVDLAEPEDEVSGFLWASRN